MIEHATAAVRRHRAQAGVRAPRGEPRLRALIARLLDWPENGGLPGGCPMLGAAAELDDRPGPARDALVAQQNEWLDTLANLARVAVAEGHFHKRLAAEGAAQFAFEFFGIQAAYHHCSACCTSPTRAPHAAVAFDGADRARQGLIRPRPAASAAKERPPCKTENSTNVRATVATGAITWLKRGLGALAALAPEHAGALAARLFLRPPARRNARRARVRGAAAGRPLRRRVRGRDLAGLSAGARDRR